MALTMMFFMPKSCAVLYDALLPNYPTHEHKANRIISFTFKISHRLCYIYGLEKINNACNEPMLTSSFTMLTW